MTAYFDTSALVPLVIEEPSSAVCERAWHAAGTVATSTLAYVETHTALAQARRLDRLTDTQLRRATEAFETVWNQVVSVSPSDDIIRMAATLGAEHALRGYDAVHCATALAAMQVPHFAVSGDRALVSAWSQLGLTTVDANHRLDGP
ncbi:MAG: type II toxin-antitoxin system VapC family toxin [Microbacteriaceae bacterium]